MMGFLVLIMVLFAIGRAVKGEQTVAAQDPGFANYAVTSSERLEEESDADSTDLEVAAAAEVESINAGSFKPYLAGDVDSKNGLSASVIR